MAVDRDPRTGKFYNTAHRYSDDTFAEITNKEILEEVKSLGARIGRVETKLDSFHKLASLISPTITCVVGAITAVWYVRH
jgi:hypothetical protein